MRRTKSPIQRRRDVSPNSLSLPSGFAEKLIQLEMDLDFNCTLPVLKQLLEQYSKAIEHYNSIGDSRYLQYQGRMNNLLVREDVKAAMTSEGPVQKRPTSANLMRHKRQADTQRRVRAEQLVKSSNENTAAKSAEQIVNKVRDTSATSARNIRRDLVSQQSSLNERLQNRIRQRSVDIAAKKPGTSSPKPQIAHSAAYEKTLEYFVEKKLTRLAAIKKKYSNTSQNDEARKKMNSEVEQVVQELEREKNEALEKLRRQYENDTKNDS